MLSKIKTLLSSVLPYKKSEEEIEFTRLNSKLWHDNEAGSVHDSNNNILVEGLLTCPASIIDKARIAKAIQEATGGTITVFVRGFHPAASNVTHIYKSFGISKFYFWWRNYLNPLIMLSALHQTIKVFSQHNTGEKLIAMNYKGIEIGDLVYDSLIRFKPNTYTIKKLNIKDHFRLIFRAFYTFDNNERILKKFKPKYLVSSHNVYAEFGMLPRQIRAANRGVVFLKDIDVYKCYTLNNGIKEHFLKIDRNVFEEKLASKEYDDKAKAYFQDRISGNVSQIDVINAYRNKKNYTIEQLKEVYPGVNPEAKNIFVMSHAFSDAPHVGEGLLFQDYYQFLEGTLKVLNNVEGINCFVKTHPSSYMWNEKGGVETLIENNKLDNVYILPSDLNTNCIVDLADGIVTAKGTAGLEFSGAGIPAITAGKGFYYGFDIAVEPETQEEYFAALRGLSAVKPLDSDKTHRALVLLYLVSTNKIHSDILPERHILPGDDYQKLFREKYSEVNNKIQQGVEMKDEFYYSVKEDAVQTHV